ncbi:hypothetical protein ABPG72_000504 [Tetrahymena utriculariae]
MNQLDKDFSDVEQFLLKYYSKCPQHKRFIQYLKLDDQNESHVMKCNCCIQSQKYKSFIDIVELIQNQGNSIFNGWPIYDDDSIYRNLQEINKWFNEFKPEDIDNLFDEIQRQLSEALQNKKKQILNDLKKIDEIKQEPILFYNKISQKDKLVNIIKTQYTDQSKQNKLIQEIIQENQQNYQQNKNQLIDLINKANKCYLDKIKIQTMKDDVLAQINELQICDFYENNQNWVEIKISKLEDLDKCQDYKKISINLANINLDSHATRAMTNSLIKCNGIINLELWLSQANICDQGAQNISERLIKHQDIQVLIMDLSNNKIGIIGANDLAKAIKKIKNLTQLFLDLSKNNNFKEAIENLATAIGKNQKMKHLSLGLENNNIGTEGAKCIAKSISYLQNLIDLYLFLGDNNINDLGALYILNAIKNYQNITKLDICFWKSKINSAIALPITEILQNYHNLSELCLYLKENMIGSEGVMLIVNEIEKRNKQIQRLSLYLKKNEIDEVNKKQLTEKFELLKQTKTQWIAEF